MVSGLVTVSLWFPLQPCPSQLCHFWASYLTSVSVKQTFIYKVDIGIVPTAQDFYEDLTTTSSFSGDDKGCPGRGYV